MSLHTTQSSIMPYIDQQLTGQQNTPHADAAIQCNNTIYKKTASGGNILHKVTYNIGRIFEQLVWQNFCWWRGWGRLSGTICYITQPKTEDVIQYRPSFSYLRLSSKFYHHLYKRTSLFRGMNKSPLHFYNVYLPTAPCTPFSLHKFTICIDPKPKSPWLWPAEPGPPFQLQNRDESSFRFNCICKRMV